jgi:acyl-CoA-binding protein
MSCVLPDVLRLRCHAPHGATIPLRIENVDTACCDARLPTGSLRTMSDLKARFEQAAKDVQGLSERPDNETLLRLYALYKQGSEGDVSGPKPGFFDFVGTAKYEAWAKLQGTGQDEAMQKYIDLVGKLTA